MNFMSSAIYIILIHCFKLVFHPHQVSASPSCAKPNGLVTEGYEEKGDKYYKKYAAKEIYLTARDKCRSVGARLIMMKNSQEFQIAKDYRATLSSDMWVGLVNSNFEHFDSTSNDAVFVDKLKWVDGTVSDAATTSYFGSVDANGRQYCMRMRSNYHIGDRGCTETYPYVCQYDCDDPYTKDSESITCPGLPSGFDSIYFGKAYKTFYGNKMSYSDAQETCRAAGGLLPNIKTNDEFLATRVMAGFATEQIWLGLTIDPSDSCSNPSGCQGKAKHHDPGNTDLPDDDTYESFSDGGWINVGMSLDGSVGGCAIMDNDNTNTIGSRECDSQTAHFVCQARCSPVVDCLAPPTAGDHMGTTWTADNPGSLKDAQAM